MKKYLRFTLFFFLFIASSFRLFSENLLSEVVIENGLSLYLLEDTSTPLVRIEYVCRAGTAAQTPSTNGFFKLYSQILKKSLPQIKFSQVYSDADSTHYVILAPAFYTREYLNLLSQAAFSLQYSDQLLEGEIASLRKAAEEDKKSPGPLINAAIDSRVFSSAPWKQESGLYPQLFENIRLENARTILNTISDYWYTPQNSAVFISGNIDKTKTEEWVKESFGSYYSNYRRPMEKELISVNKDRKYVFHSPELSPDIVQLVLQYSSLDFEEASLMAAALNNDYSAFKNELLKESSLLIPGYDYINAAAAHKNNSSRLIIQSILQKNKKSTSLSQVLKFIALAKAGIEKLDEADTFYASQSILSDFERRRQNSLTYMEKLSEFWVYKPFLQLRDFNFDIKEGGSLLALQEGQKEKIQVLQAEPIKAFLQAEEPFVFVMLNSSEYNKCKNDYKKAGFKEINSSNAFWYSQKQYDSVKKELEEKAFTLEKTNYFQGKKATALQASFDNDYYQKNIDSLKIESLDNGISLASKHNDNSSEIIILLSIQGGRLKSAADDGFEEVMINLLAENIQKEIYKQQLQMNIIGNPRVDYECQLTSSSIWVECEKADFAASCRAISNAIIYGEVQPASADRAVSYVQYNKRIEGAGLANQLYSAVLGQLYSGAPITRLYDTKKEILTDITYQKILGKYQELLDASRYSVILTGNFDSNYSEIINKTLGLMNNLGFNPNLLDLSAVFPKNKELFVLLDHKFYANPQLDKNAPMPALLIPTTDFSDPAIYLLKAPPKQEPQYLLFEAILLYLKELQPASENYPKFSLIPPDSQTDFAGVLFQNVKTKAQAEEAYKKLISLLTAAFSQEQLEESLQKIKDNWIIQKMSQASTNAGTARLLQKGLEYFPYQKDFSFYLKEYDSLQKASSQDLLQLLQYFPAEPLLKVYSMDTK